MAKSRRTDEEARRSVRFGRGALPHAERRPRLRDGGDVLEQRGEPELTGSRRRARGLAERPQVRLQPAGSRVEPRAAGDSSVILLHPPLPLAGVSIETMAGWGC